jgi:streptogramin lyase
MARLTTESERVTACCESRQQLQTKVSERSFRITPPRKRAAAQPVAVVDRICATVRGALRLTAALLGVAAFATLGGTALKAQTASFTATQRTLGSGFDSPSDVAVDSSGNLFVADSRNNAVKEILAAGGYTTGNTLAAAYGNFNGVAVDASGNLFVTGQGASFFTLQADPFVEEILKVGGYTTVYTLGSGFTDPYGVAVGASGIFYVAGEAKPALWRCNLVARISER